MIELKKVIPEEFGKITDFYRYVIEKNVTMSTYCPWKYGLYPNDDVLKGYIDKGEIYYYKNDNEIVSCIVIMDNQDPLYKDINWKHKYSPEEIAVIHLFCVNPDYMRQGIGPRVIGAALDMAKSMGKKAVQLDALAINKPARKLYEKIGFKCAEIVHWYSPCVNWEDFVLYEYKFS